MKIVFTIAANNYLNQVDVLGKSIRQHNSEIEFVVIIADTYSAEIQYENLNCNRYVFIDEIIEDKELLNQLSNKYTITEFCTTVKPDCFLYFDFHFGARKVVYLDPDIKLFSPMVEVFELFETFDVILTPHVCSPTPVGVDPSDHNLMKTGVFNLGFLALKINDETKQFLNWWKHTLYSQGQSDIPRGYFYDQIWWMLGVCFLDKVKILRHLGYNMCNWNLHERFLSKDGRGNYIVNDSIPLRFFHFSHLKKEALPLLASYNSTYTIENRPDVKNIYLEYLEDIDNEFTMYKSIKPSFGIVKAKKVKNRMNKIKRFKLIMYHAKRLLLEKH
jgi:hypothetical protein